jgi:hypothetical protein
MWSLTLVDIGIPIWEWHISNLEIPQSGLSVMLGLIKEVNLGDYHPATHGDYHIQEEVCIFEVTVLPMVANILEEFHTGYLHPKARENPH